MAMLLKRTYLFPSDGYLASVDRQLAPLSYITGDSHDWRASPTQRQLLRRGGVAIIGTNPWHEVTTSVAAGNQPRLGMTESNWYDVLGPDPVVWHVFTQFNQANQNSYPLMLLGVANFGVIAGFSNVGVFGFYTLGRDFSLAVNPALNLIASYPLTAAEPLLKVIPLAFRGISPNLISAVLDRASFGQGTTLLRGAHEFSRRLMAAGARNAIRIGDWTYCGGFQGTPFAWNGNWSPDPFVDALAVQPALRNRIRPWGNLPGPFPPTKGPTVASTGSDANWEDGDTYYTSVIFERNDGGYSMPFIPRPVSSVVTAAKGGLFTIGTIGGTNKYRSVEWQDIAIGPEGTRARLLCRSAKVKLTSATDPALATIDVSKLFITARIPNNTQTKYIDPNGSNAAVVDDPRVVRFDNIWPPSAKYVFEFDQRAGVGFTQVNPSALVLYPTGLNASRDFNADDTNAAKLFGTNAFLYNINKNQGTGVYQILLRQFFNLNTAPVTVFTATKINSTDRLQDLIDEINATGIPNEWACQLAPGADINSAPTDLAPTSVTVPNLNWTGGTDTTAITQSPFTADWARDIQIGMKVYDASGKIPLGAHVISRSAINTGYQTVTVAFNGSVALASAGATTLIFYSDAGDDNDTIALTTCSTVNASPFVGTTSTNAFCRLKAGMLVTGAGIPANTYVRRIVKPQQLELTGNATATAGPITLTFAQTGWCADASPLPRGNVRAFAPSWPGVAFYRGPYLDKFSAQSRDIYFTVAAPSTASYQADSFVLPNRRTVPATAGYFMGGAPLQRGAVLVYSKAIYWLLNERGGNTFEDFDYHILPINTSRGGISPRSVKAFHGVVGYMTRDGYVVTDGRQERLISGAIWDPGTGIGEWANDMNLQGTVDLELDSDRFSATVYGSQIYITYAAGTRRLVYDFSAGEEANGLAGILKSDGSAYPWSSPDIVSCGPGCEIKTNLFWAPTNIPITRFSVIPEDFSTLGFIEGHGTTLGIDAPPIAGFFFDNMTKTAIACTFSAGSNRLTAVSPGGFSSIAIGARFMGDGTKWPNSGITNITGKDLISGNYVDCDRTALLASGASQSFNFYGKEVEPIGYMATDSMEALRLKKKLHRVTSQHRSSSDTSLSLVVFRDRERTTGQVYQLRASGPSGQRRQVVPMNQRTRSPGEVVECAIQEDGSNSTTVPQFWGLEAEAELVDSQT